MTKLFTSYIGAPARKHSRSSSHSRSMRALAIVTLTVTGFAALGLTVLDAATATASTFASAVMSATPGAVSTAVASTAPQARPTSTPAAATPTPVPAPAVTAAPQTGISVSSPDGTLQAPPGTTVDTWLRVGNSAATPLSVTIAPATVNLGNDGVTGFTPQPDPRFAGHITLSQTEAVIPAGGYIQVDVKVSIPTTIVPDIYVLGFLVSSEATGASVRLVNRIGSLIAFDVPGSRDRHLTAAFTTVPWIMFTNHPTLTVRTHSVGKSALEFTSQDALTGFGAVTPAITRNDPRLLPAGTHRDLTVAWNVPWGFGVDTVTTTLLYPKTVSGNAQIVLSHRVIVIKPLLALIAGAMLLVILAIIALAIVHSRRSRPVRRGTWEATA